ncbi:MAG: hypothetical protein COB46_02190 [Rhodospirillaceae bacterium]|nr:MAG: hypothetical protein COB46_02190 [Rhodospirillaceae bacterium]
MNLLEPITISYKGSWADDNKLPLREFARSADGLDDILGLCAEFAITHKIILRRPARSVRLVTQAPQPGSFEFIPLVEAVFQNQFVISASSGLFAALTTLVFSRLANKSEQSENRIMVEKLLEEIGRDRDRNQEMLETFILGIDKKRAAGIRSVCTIGAGCDEIVIAKNTPSEIHLNPADREMIELGPEAEIETQRVRVIISELDRVTGGCRVSFDGERKRYRGVVLDPAVRGDGNFYATAFAQGTSIDVIADISIVEGEIKKVMIISQANESM